MNTTEHSVKLRKILVGRRHFKSKNKTVKKSKSDHRKPGYCNNNLISFSFALYMLLACPGDDHEIQKKLMINTI